MKQNEMVDVEPEASRSEEELHQLDEPQGEEQRGATSLRKAKKATHQIQI